jgi:hypothetical protein
MTSILKRFDDALDALKSYKATECVDSLQLAIEDMQDIQDRVNNPELFAGALEFIQDHKDTECMDSLALAIEDIQNIKALAVSFIAYRP